MRVAKEKLLLIAGFVWLAAGLNIAILGVSAFAEMGEHAMLVLVPAAIVAFTVFHGRYIWVYVLPNERQAYEKDPLLSPGNKTCLELFRPEIISHYGVHDDHGHWVAFFGHCPHVVHRILLCWSWHRVGSFWLLLLSSLLPRRRHRLPLGAPYG